MFTLLIFLAYGWYTKKIYFKDSEIVYVIGTSIVIIAIMMAFSYAIVNVLTKINDGSSDKYHFHDSFPSKILIGYLFVIMTIFYIGIGYTNDSRNWKKKQTK